MKKKTGKFQEIISWINNKPLQALIALVVGLAVIVAGYFIVRYVIIPIAVVAFVVWAILGFPIPTLMRPSALPPTFDVDICASFMCEVLTEISDLIGIRKPYDESSIKMYPPVVPKGSIHIFQCKASQADNAETDDYGREKCRLILQERINDSLNAGTAKNISIAPCFFPGIPSLYVDEVTALGNRFVFDIVWAVDEAAREYIQGRQMKQDKYTDYLADDEEL